MMFPCLEMSLADPKSSAFDCKLVNGTDGEKINPYRETFFTQLRTIFETRIGSKLCPEMCASTVSLNYLESINCNVIVMYGGKDGDKILEQS